MSEGWASTAGPFVGRAREMEALDRLVAGGARLVTLLGVGGVGKTRLALEWARSAEGALRREGVSLVFCDLSEARSVDDASAAVARVLGVPLAATATAAESVAQVGRALGELERAVVVLDNLEQLAPLSPALIEPWLALAPQALFVVTSRERLRLREEQSVPVEPLAVPPAGEQAPAAIAATEAVQLFVARTRAARSDFALADADAPAVAAVVRALEGLPLAIELCAARMGVLELGQILPRLARRFDLLVTGARGAPRRHATLREAIAWSWDLLEPWEQEALAQASVFRGGFSLAAAEAVLDLGAAAPPVLDALQSLNEKSLLRVLSPPGSPGERRYGLFESVRELAGEALERRSGAAAASARHASFFVGPAGSPLPRKADLGRLSLEADNLAAACQRALERADAGVALRALLLLEPLFLVSAKGRLGPYAESLDAAIEAATRSPPADATLVARARYTRAVADLLRGRIGECFTGFQGALASARAAGARLEQGLSLTKLGLMLEHGDLAGEARGCFEEAQRIARELGDPALDGDYLLTRGGALTWLGRADEAAWHHAQALEKFALAGDPSAQAMAAGQLALARLNQGRLAEGEAAAALALSFLHEREEHRMEGYVLGVLGRLHQARGRFDEARATLAAAIQIHRAVGDRWSEGVHHGYLGHVAFEERRLADARAAYREAVSLLRGTGERHYTAISLAALGAVELAQGEAEAAREHLDQAASALAGVRVAATRVNVDLYRAFADVEEARRAAAAGEVKAAAWHRRAVTAQLALAEAPTADGSASVSRGSEDVRFALRMLVRALDAGEGDAERAASGPLPVRAPSPMLLVVGPEVRWLRVGDREPVSMLKARAARLILSALVRARLDTPGVALPLEALGAAGWPGERIAPRAAANRIYVTLTKLKNLGLRGLIQSRDDGFLLDPGATVLEALAEPAPS